MSKLAEQKIKEYTKKYGKKWQKATPEGELWDDGYDLDHPYDEILEWLIPTFQEIEQARDEEIIEKVEGMKIKKEATFLKRNDGLVLDWNQIAGFNLALDDLVKSLSKQ